MGLPILGHPNRYRIDGSAARYGEGIFDGYADAGIGLNYCRRFVDHYILAATTDLLFVWAARIVTRCVPVEK